MKLISGVTPRSVDLCPVVTDKTRLLRIEAPHFVAGAVCVHREAGWFCSNTTAPILRWMSGKSPEEVVLYLRRKGWSYSWVRISE